MRFPKFVLRALLVVTGALPAGAQSSPADSLLGAGQLSAAESVLFAQAAARPRDPVARMALGRYLGARGAWRVGAVLLEEARFFGANPRDVAESLAPLYRSLGDYRALVTLPSSPLAMGERAQAAWMVSHTRTVQMPESTVVQLRGTADLSMLGVVSLRVGRRTIQAAVDPRRSGIVLSPTFRDSSVRVFRHDSTATLTGVAPRVQIGEIALSNQPVRYEMLPAGVSAVIGLDLLAAWAPTFDLAHGRLVLRRIGRVPADSTAERIPLLLRGDTLVVTSFGPQPASAPDVARVLRNSRWTLDLRRGEIRLGS